MKKDGVSEKLKFLWSMRDAALENEKRKGVTAMSSSDYTKAQRKIDNYFFPIQQKAQRGKTKKQFIKDDDWG